MLPFIDDVFVNLVGEDVQVIVLPHHIGDGTEFVRTHHRARGVLGRVEDDETGVLVDVGGQVVQVGVVRLLL